MNYKTKKSRMKLVNYFFRVKWSWNCFLFTTWRKKLLLSVHFHQLWYSGSSSDNTSPSWGDKNQTPPDDVCQWYVIPNHSNLTFESPTLVTLNEITLINLP